MNKQVIEIRKGQDIIKKKALRLYQIVNSKTQPKLNARCCNFVLLESVVLGVEQKDEQVMAEIAGAADEMNKE